jgi:streptogramin lyase
MARVPSLVMGLCSLALAACGGGGGGNDNGGGEPKYTGSNHLWVADFNGSAAYGYSFAQISSTSAASAEIGAGTGALSGLEGMALASNGDLWLASRSADRVFRLDRAQLQSWGVPTPAAAFMVDRPWFLMIDKARNLWTTDYYGVVTRYQSSDVAGTGTLTPTASLTVQVPSGNVSELLLDGAGHLWIADEGDGSSEGAKFLRAPDSLLTATGTPR